MDKELKEKLKRFVIDNFMQGEGSLNDSESLFENNIIDSFGLLELIAFVEKNFHISINPTEAAIENFDSLDKIAKLVGKKLKSGKKNVA